jgi:uncharacterized membrane protein YagU involved in acid resistance
MLQYRDIENYFAKSPHMIYEKRFSTVFQLITSQMALKYSALRFWYCKLFGY